MDYTDWHILQTLAHENNLTVVAKKLFITQPAITYRIKCIEKELKIPILIHSGRNITLTGQGILAAQYAEEMIERYEKMRNVLSTMHNKVTGSVNLAVSPIIARYKLPDIISRFCQKYPLVNIYIKTTLSNNAINALLKNEAQLAIIRGNYNLSLKTHLLSKEPITLISKNYLELDNLPDYPYIQYETDTPLEREIIDWWREHFDRPPHTIMHINDSFTCRQLVAQGLGFSILPAIGAKPINSVNFKTINLSKKNGTPLTRSTWLIYKEQNLNSTCVQALVTFLRNNFKALKN